MNSKNINYQNLIGMTKQLVRLIIAVLLALGLIIVLMETFPSISILSDNAFRFIIRIGLVVISVLSVIGLWRISQKIENEELQQKVNSMMFFFIGFVTLRILSAFIDPYLSYKEVGIISVTVTYAFNLYILMLIRGFYNRLGEKQFLDITNELPLENPKYIDKTKLSGVIDEAFDIMKISRSKTRDLRVKVENLGNGKR